MKYLFPLLYFCLLCLVPSALLQAQGSYIPTLYNTSNGLPQQTVNAMIQDKQGYIWFATSNGFSRFDGEHFTTYRLDDDDDNIGVGNNLITLLKEDQHRYIWLTNDNGRTMRFNPSTKEFFPLPASFGKVKDLQLLSNGDMWILFENNVLVRAYYDEKKNLHYEKIAAYSKFDRSEICMISNDREGLVWILTNKCLMEYDYQKKRLVRHIIGLGDTFHCLRKRLNLLQIGGSQGRVYLYHKNKNNYTHIQLPTKDNIIRIKAFTDDKSIYMTAEDGFFLHNIKTGEMQHYSTNHASPYHLESNLIGDCYVDKDKNIWVTYLNNPTITCLETSCNKQRLYQLQDRHREDIRNCHKISIFEDRNKRIWFYAQDKALNYYDIESQKLLPLILPATQNMPDFTEPSILYIDKQRNIWLGKTNKGVMKITLKSDHFKLYSPEPGDLYSNENQTQGLCLDRHNRLWMGTQDSTIHIFDARTYKFLGYFSDKGAITPNKTYIGQANAILEDHEGNIWIGTEERGLLKATPQSNNRFTLERFTHNPQDCNSISGNRISFLLEDKARRIWVGTARKGLNCITRDANGKYVFLHGDKLAGGYPENYLNIRCLCEDKPGRIWIATTQGILRFKPNNGQLKGGIFEDLSNVHTDHGNFNSSSVFYIFRTRNNDLYFATFGKGLCRLQTQNNEHTVFTKYTTKNGLTSNIIYTMQEDIDGNIWLATEGGLCKFNPKEQTFDTFDNRFFPSDLTFSGNDAINGLQDELIFATDRGFLTFNPKDIQKEPFKPNIVLTSFTANDRVLYNEDGQPFSFDTAQQVILRHDQNSFNLLFRALDMNFPDKVQYAYKLEGFDDWHYVGDEPKAIYTNIPRGKYVFRVRSTNSDGQWVENERVLNIRILPSFWESPWGIVLSIVLLLLLTGIISSIVLVLYKLKQRVVIERRLAEVKTNVFTNLVHEMRTPFTLIVSPLENVLAQKDLSPQVRQNLEIMQKNTNRSIRLINQILDYQKIESDKMHLCVRRIELRSFFEQLLNSFSGLAESEKTKLLLQMEAPSLTIWADADKLESIFFNLLSNAFKYSPKGKQIIIHVKGNEHSVTIDVTDQGYGIPENKQNQIFCRFESFVQKHAPGTSSTGIGLALIKELVELHHGHITVNSQVNAGSTFTVELLKGNKHFDEDTEFIVDDGDSETEEDDRITPHCKCEDTLPVVLIVEDNDDLRRFLETTFAAEYHPLTAVNGEEGFKQALLQTPDIIISDIQMPIVNGIEMVRMLKTNLATSHIPIILLTSQSSMEGQIESLEMGVEDYIPKPFSSKVLLARVHNILQRRKQLQQFYQSQIIKPDIADQEETTQQKPTKGAVSLPPAEQAFIQRITDYINAHLSSADLSVESLAHEVNISRSVLFKKTKALIGLSPMELIRDLRFRKAAALLEDGEHTVTEIAFLTGFYDSHYFSKSFKQVYGVSPSDYRKGKHQS